MTLPRREICKSGKTCEIINEAVPGSCAWECLKFKEVEMMIKCDGCGYISKEHEEGDMCPMCDGGHFLTVEDERQKEMTDWLNILKDYADGKKWDTGGPWVCEAHSLMPHDGGYSFDCDCGSPGMPPFTYFGEVVGDAPNAIIIETVEEDGSKWGISFTDSNPAAKDYVGCASYKDAEKLQAKLKEVNFIVA